MPMHKGFVMFTTRTIIGIVAGAVIIGISLASLISDLTGGPLVISEEYDLGETASYSITGDEGATHSMTITADRFQLKLESPGEGFSMPATEFEGSHSIQWVHQQSGRTLIQIQNIGDGMMSVDATLEITEDPIWLAYRLVVITTGVIIIGLSLGFSVRKPKGF